MRKLALVLFAVLAVFAVASCSGGGDDGNGSVVTGTTGSTGGGPPVDGRVVFVGASITDGWDFEGYFPVRDFNKVIFYDADKTQVWGDVEGYQPEIVVVKECAAYFYTDGGTPLADYEGIVQNMVGLVRGIGATPVLATTIPVDVGAGGTTDAQLADIAVFNDWLRSYCDAEGIVCMDLARAIADSEGQLPSDCHDGDGLHPNGEGYRRLSEVVIPALEQAGL